MKNFLVIYPGSAHLASGAGRYPPILIKPGFSKKMTKNADIINFVLRKKIDRIQLTIKHPWFDDVLQRSMLFLNHDSEAEYKKRTIWNFNHKHDDRKTLNIISVAV